MVAPDGKESAFGAGHLDFVPGFERSPGEGYGYPLQYSGLENSRTNEQRSLADYSLWACKSSDTTQQLKLSQ